MNDNLPIKRGDMARLVRSGFESRQLEVVSNGRHGLKLRCAAGRYFGHGRGSLRNRLRAGQAITVLFPGIGHIGCDVRHVGRRTITLRRYVAVESRTGTEEGAGVE